MKKLVCVLAAVACAVTAFGQGKLIFNNNAATAITNVDSAGISLGRAPVGTHVALYYSTSLTATDSELLFSNDVNTNTFAAGLFLGGTRTMAGTTGTILAQVRAWTGPFASYEAAMGSGDTQYFAGKSGSFQILLAEGTTPPPAITAAGRLTAFTMSPVPEPSTLALGAMGLLGLYLIRRRK